MFVVSLDLKLLHPRAGGPKVSIHRTPLTFPIFLVALLAALLQFACVGLTSTEDPASSTDPPQATPSIITQPASQTVTAGQTATFTVAATGTTPLSYQWKKNGASISGATSSSYTTPATTSSDNGAQFTVVVSNTAGNATSKAATLTVDPATALPHWVTLYWSPSTSSVTGYNVYRSSVSGGSYTKLNSTVVTTSSYYDSTVQVGQTYYYVVTSMNSSNIESTYSSEVSAAVPSP